MMFGKRKFKIDSVARIKSYEVISRTDSEKESQEQKILS